MTFEQAVATGLRVWATVLRRDRICTVPGGTVKEGELLSWTYEGADRWWTVGVVTYRLI